MRILSLLLELQGTESTETGKVGYDAASKGLQVTEVLNVTQIQTQSNRFKQDLALIDVYKVEGDCI